MKFVLLEKLKCPSLAWTLLVVVSLLIITEINLFYSLSIITEINLMYSLLFRITIIYITLSVTYDSDGSVHLFILK